eukprot:TRINITY_DN5982_c0_g1_i1.p1 TRINITY_DN5982_c0_g1~~TRINITY_DN5982_c0_g1_i1.p1  ORF type:complete len:403 (+),score=107.57 TRINITY_DN5982_c0_g1_i1:79-1287(+)
MQLSIYPLACVSLVIQTILAVPHKENVGGCQINPDSQDWPEWPPIVTNEVGDLILAAGEENNRVIDLDEDQTVLISCGGGGEFADGTLGHVDGLYALYARCLGGTEFEITYDDTDPSEIKMNFRDLGCEAQPLDSNEIVGTCGPNNEGKEIVIGFDMLPAHSGTEAAVLTVCYDTETSVNIWSRHSLWDEINARDHNNDSPFFNPDDYFDFDVNHYYTMATQKETIAGIVRSEDLADKYVQDFDSGLFLARGHLAPNADFIFYSWMDATYHFVNVAPQWQAFNGGNWMYFENGCRDFAVDRQLDLVVYTGTHGVCQLEDVDGEMVDIFLYNGDRLPVPRYYWKVLFDPLAGAGVAVIGVNNPHLTTLPSDYLISPSLADHHPGDRPPSRRSWTDGYIVGLRG